MAKATMARPNKRQKAEVKQHKVTLPDPVSDEEELDQDSQEEEEDEVEDEEDDDADQDNEEDDDEEEKEDEENEDENAEESEEEKEEEEEEEEEFKSTLSFAQLGLASWLSNALKAMSITSPSEIQTKCIPQILSGKDVIGGAKTGSGKTAAFALPILQKLSEDPYGVFAVILTPTR